MTESLQRQICCYIETYHRRHGYAPTAEEVREGLGTKSKRQFAEQMDELRANGVIDWVDRQPRTLIVKMGIASPHN